MSQVSCFREKVIHAWKRRLEQRSDRARRGGWKKMGQILAMYCLPEPQLIPRSERPT